MGAAPVAIRGARVCPERGCSRNRHAVNRAGGALPKRGQPCATGPDGDSGRHQTRRALASSARAKKTPPPTWAAWRAAEPGAIASANRAADRFRGFPHTTATVAGEPSSSLSPNLRERIGYVPQQPSQFGWLTGKQMLAYTASFYSRFDQDYVRELLD